MTAPGARASPASPTAAPFGAVMALVALTVASATLGVYLGRDSGGAPWFIAWLLSLGCLIGLNVASRRGQYGLALRQAFGATALTVPALGAGDSRCAAPGKDEAIPTRGGHLHRRPQHLPVLPAALRPPL